MQWASPIANRLSDLGEGALRLLPGLAVGLTVLVLAYLAGKAAKFSVRRATGRLERRRNVALILGGLAQWAAVLFGLFAAMVVAFPSLEVAHVLQVLGISSVAIGFAFRDVLQNFLAGIILLWTQPFRIGDQIVFKEFEGTVLDIQTRATFVRTYDGRRIVIPNGELFTNAMTVNTASDERRVEYDLRVGPGEDIERARALILGALAELEEVLRDPEPDVRVIELGDDAVVLRVRWWIHPPMWAHVIDARDQVLTRVRDRLTGGGVELPYPTRVVLLRDLRSAE